MPESPEDLASGFEDDEKGPGTDKALEENIRKQARVALPGLLASFIADMEADTMPRHIGTKKQGIQLLAQLAFNTGALKNAETESGEDATESIKDDLKKAVQEAMAMDPSVKNAVIRGRIGKAVNQ